MEKWLKNILDHWPIARLATSFDGNIHLIPVVFVRHGTSIYSPIDGKPKSARKLQRIIDIETNPQITLLLDQYDDEWSKLWWVRITGTARCIELESEVRISLISKYPAYQNVSVGHQCIQIDISNTTRWAFDPTYWIKYDQ